VTTGGKAREAHIAFAAANRVAVQAFHDAAAAHGAEVPHAPKGRPEYTGYGALVRDPDGNGVEALCHR
jgi:predicted lactoylglutathione lyase